MFILLKKTVFFSQQTYWLVTKGKAEMYMITLKIDSVFHSSMCRQLTTIEKTTDTETTEWNLTVIHFITSACAFPTLTC